MNLKQLPFYLIVILLLTTKAQSQSFTRAVTKSIPVSGTVVLDTINVTGLTTSALSGTFGLDTMSLKINHNGTGDLRISLTAPDGTTVQLATNLGGGSNNFTNTCFDMGVSTLINLSSPPFTGHMRPEGWLGMVNNGQNGNGKWILRIINTVPPNNNTGSLISWGLHFNSTPAPPSFLTSSTLPIVSIIIPNNGVVPIEEDSSKITAHMGIVYNGVSQINQLAGPFNNYNGNIGISLRGSSSRAFAQKSYSVETRTALGADSNVSLLGMPSESDWVLYGAWDDKSLVRNVITYQFSNDMGRYASRTRYCELFINGDYRGVYVLMEKIKRDNNRVDIKKMGTTDTAAATVSGGYILQVDRAGVNDHFYSAYPFCTGGTTKPALLYEYPKPEDIVPAQKTYIQSYVNQFETALKNGNVYDTANGYRHYADAATFIDQCLLQEIGHNVDGYRLSSYLYKDRGGKLMAGPIWDMNLAYGNADYFNGSATNTWEWNLPCSLNDPNLIPFWWKQLLTDTVYMKDLKCRYTTLRQTTFDTTHMNHMIDSLVTVLQVPQTHQFTRWPILGHYLWPNNYVGNTWTQEVDTVKHWLKARVKWMDSTLYNPVCLQVSHQGIAEAGLNDGINIFPNPSNGNLNITSYDKVTSITIYSMLGQKVYEQYINDNKFNISLQQLHLSGMYNVVLRTEKAAVSRKIIFE